MIIEYVPGLELILAGVRHQAMCGVDAGVSGRMAEAESTVGP